MNKLLLIGASLLFALPVRANPSPSCTVQFNNGNNVVTEQCFGLNWKSLDNSYVIYAMTGHHLIVLTGSKNAKRKDHILFISDFSGAAVFDKSTEKKVYTGTFSGECKIHYNQAIECEGGDFMLNSLLEEDSTQ